MFSQIISEFYIDGNSAAVWEIQTDFTKRPIRLLVDTGAQITLIASDVLTHLITLGEKYYTLTGISGQSNPIATNGSHNGHLITENGTLWPIEIHTVNREYAGIYDGYLGFDFMMMYGAVIDLRNGTIKLHSGIDEENNRRNEEQLFARSNEIENESNSDASYDNIDNDEMDTLSDSNMHAGISSDLNFETNAQEEFAFPSVANHRHETRPIIEQNTMEENAQSPTSSEAPLNDIPLSQNSSLENKYRLNDQTSLNEIFSLSEFNTPLKTADDIKNVSNDFKMFMAEVQSKTFSENDDDTQRLKKIMNYKVKLNKQANCYVRYFGSKKVSVSNKSPNFAALNVRAANPANRAQQILQNLKTNHMKSEEYREISEVVRKYPHQFFVEGDKLTIADIATHRIFLKPGTGIINVKQFRLPEQQKIKISQATQKMYHDHIIRDSKSPFNAPTFMVPKKNAAGEKIDDRQVHDYRQLNDATVMQKYPIPLIQELVDNFSKSKFMSKLDIERAFYQIPMQEEHKHYTAFTVGYKKYEFNRMPFGLAGAPITMQAGITNIFADLMEKQKIGVYMDDIVIHTETFEEHMLLLNEVFSRLEKHNLQVKIPKCEFLVNKIEYLGFIVEPGKVYPNPAKTRAITNFPIPKTRKQLQSFLGMTNYFRHFIRFYAKIARPLTRLTSTNLRFQMDDDALTTFNLLKRILVEDITLNIADFSKDFIVTTDASDGAIGAMLSQIFDDGERPIYFFSRVLTDAEKNYPTHEKELLAITCAIEEFENYLVGKRFTVKTDSQCLVYLFKHPHKNKRLLRQAVSILDANFNIMYQPGKLNVVADALSRVEILNDEWHQMPVHQFVEKHANSSKQMKRMIKQSVLPMGNPTRSAKIMATIIMKAGQSRKSYGYDHIYTIISASNKEKIDQLMTTSAKSNALLQKINDKHSLMLVKSMPVNHQEIEKIVDKLEKHVNENELNTIAIETDLNSKALFLLKHELSEKLDQMKLRVSIHATKIIELSDPSEIAEALKMHHDLRLGGHMGINRMISTMKQIYHWPNMNNDIKNYVNECLVCQRAKVTKYTRMPMQITSTGTRPFEHVYLDHVGPINPPSAEGYKHIFIATCDLTKYTVCMPCKDTAADTTADCFLKTIILQFGFPAEITHDGGTAFSNETLKSLNKKLKIKDITSSPYNPRANIVERRNRSLAEYMRSYTQQKPNTWAELLPYCTFAYNISVNVTTGFSPFELIYGRSVTLPDAITKSRPVYNYDNFAELIRKELQDAWQLAQKMNQKAKETNKRYYDRKTNEIKVKVGDKIMVKKHTKDKKFDFVWNGPFEVTSVHDRSVKYKDKRKEKSTNLDYVKLAGDMKCTNFRQAVDDPVEQICRKILTIRARLYISI